MSSNTKAPAYTDEDIHSACSYLDEIVSQNSIYLKPSGTKISIFSPDSPLQGLTTLTSQPSADAHEKHLSSIDDLKLLEEELSSEMQKLHEEVEKFEVLETSATGPSLDFESQAEEVLEPIREFMDFYHNKIKPLSVQSPEFANDVPVSELGEVTHLLSQHHLVYKDYLDSVQLSVEFIERLQDPETFLKDYDQVSKDLAKRLKWAQTFISASSFCKNLEN